MKVQGFKKDIVCFTEYLKTTPIYYGYDDSGNLIELKKPMIYSVRNNQFIQVDHHLGFNNIFCVPCDEVLSQKSDNEEICMEIFGEVSLNLAVCWFDHSFISFFKNQPKAAKKYALTLPKACALLHVKAEVFSIEEELNISEHYLIDENGKIIVDESTDYYKIKLNKNLTFEKIQQKYGSDRISVTKEEFDAAKEMGKHFLISCKNVADDRWKFNLKSKEAKYD